MSFTESVIDRTRKIEKLLSDLGGVGKGLHERAGSISSFLGYQLVRRLRFVATIRNKLVHEDGYRFNGDQQEFIRTCDELISQLSALASQGPGNGRSSVPPLLHSSSKSQLHEGRATTVTIACLPPLLHSSSKSRLRVGRAMTVTIACLVVCLGLWYACTRAGSTVIKLGYVWNDREKREVIDWEFILGMAAALGCVAYGCTSSRKR